MLRYLIICLVTLVLMLPLFGIIYTDYSPNTAFVVTPIIYVVLSTIGILLLKYLDGDFEKEKYYLPYDKPVNPQSNVEPSQSKFECPQPYGKPCDRHKINDEEGRWIYCNTCKREWSR
jgi:hypothetical protein